MTFILGISALYHDSAAALIKNGSIVAAAQEERFTRVKHDPSFPRNAINFVLENSNISLQDVSYVAFYDKPFLKFERLLETYVHFAPKGFKSFSKAMPIWLREKLFLKSVLVKELKYFDHKFKQAKILFSEHHFSHAASAFFPSPFKQASVLTLDGVGEWATTSIASGYDNKIKMNKEINFPHSLGLLYSAFTYYTGFKVNSGEYKLMGLAPYGSAHYTEKIYNNLIDVKDDGSFKLDQSFFDYASGLKMTSQKFEDLFGQPARIPETQLLTQFHMDIAASIQKVTEEILLKIARYIKKQYKMKNLCLAGGVALNCVANGKLKNEGIFDQIWIQPAAGDAGGAIGAALAAWHVEFNNGRVIKKHDAMQGAFLGPKFNDKEIKSELIELGAKFHTLSDTQLISRTAEIISQGNAVGWFQGKMEFGPRALGCRSILADPRSKTMQKTLNLKVKYRESFRPFAPSILEENVSDYFELNCESPYMLLVATVKKNIRKKISQKEKNLFGIDKLNVIRSSVPSITHVDYSARVQTVNKDTNPRYHALIKEFYSLTGVPILINTSFNVRGEPIVCNPFDAFRCFMGTELDTLVIGNCLLYKKEQNINLLEDYKLKYQND